MPLRRYHLIALLVLTLLPHCGEAPEIVFPRAGDFAVVSGKVLPADPAVKVYLAGAQGVDSTTLNTGTEMFEFREVSYGTYYLRVTAKGYGTTELRTTVQDPVVTVPSVALSKLPLQVLSVVPSEGTAIDSAFLTDNGSYVNDSTVEVRVFFREAMDTASVRTALTVHPAMQPGIRWRNDLKSCYIGIPRAELDGDSDLVITIDTAAADRYGRHLEIDLTVSYPVAAGLGNVIAPQRLIASERPVDNEKNVPPSASLMIWFDSIMHEASVEEAFTIDPEASAPHFSWDTPSGKHRLTVSFPGGLEFDTRYTVTLAAGWHTADSSMAGSTWSYSFTTGSPAVKDFSPRNGQRSVLVGAPLLIITNFTVATEAFADAFSITPEVDSLRFLFNATENTMTISHAPFDSGTAYTVTIDSTLGAPDSTTIGRTVSFSFTTLYSPDELSAADTVAWSSSPAAGATEWPVTRAFTIIFAGEMNRTAVESLLTVTPDLSYNLVWSDPAAGGHRLDIRPRSYLWSNTRYTVSIDSGYLAATGRKTGKINIPFTTQPLRLVGHVPAHGQVNFPDREFIRLSFNMPVDESSLPHAVHLSPDDAVELRNDTADTGNGYREYVLLVRNRSTTQAGLQKNTEYVVSVDTTVTDLFGIRMSHPVSFSFTTSGE